MNAIVGNGEALQSYEIINILGKGSFGVVNLAKHKQTNTQVAIK